MPQIQIHDTTRKKEKVLNKRCSYRCSYHCSQTSWWFSIRPSAVYRGCYMPGGRQTMCAGYQNLSVSGPAVHLCLAAIFQNGRQWPSSDAMCCGFWWVI